MQVKKSSGRKRNGDDKINSTEPEGSVANDKGDNSENDEEADDLESKIDGISNQMATTMTGGNGDLAVKSEGKPQESSANLDSQISDIPEVFFNAEFINLCIFPQTVKCIHLIYEFGYFVR